MWWPHTAPPCPWWGPPHWGRGQGHWSASHRWTWLTNEPQSQEGLLVPQWASPSPDHLQLEEGHTAWGMMHCPTAWLTSMLNAAGPPQSACSNKCHVKAYTLISYSISARQHPFSVPNFLHWQLTFYREAKKHKSRSTAIFTICDAWQFQNYKSHSKNCSHLQFIMIPLQHGI